MYKLDREGLAKYGHTPATSLTFSHLVPNEAVPCETKKPQIPAGKAGPGHLFFDALVVVGGHTDKQEE